LVSCEAQTKSYLQIKEVFDVMKDVLAANPEYLIKSYEGNTVHYIDSKQLKDEIKEGEGMIVIFQERIQQATDILEKQNKNLNENIQLKAETEVKIKTGGEEKDELERKLNAKIKLYNELAEKYSIEIRQTIDRIYAILEVTNYSNAQAMINDAKRMKIEIKDRIIADFKLNVNYPCFRKVMNGFSEEHSNIIEIFMNVKQILGDLNEKKETLDPIIKHFQEEKNLELCKILQEDVSNISALEEILNDLSLKEELKLAKEDEDFMVNVIDQLRLEKMANAVKDNLK